MNESITAVVVFWNGLPVVVAAVAALLGGLLGATLARMLVAAVLGLLRFDKAADKTGLGEFLRKGGVTYTPSKLVSYFVFWILMVVVLLFLSRLLDIAMVTSFTERLGEIVPGVIAALLIVGIGLLFANFASNFTRTILRNAGSAHPDLIAQAVRSFGVGVVLLIALEELNIGKTILNSLVLIFSATVGLGLALAFGLGCKDMAREWLERMLSNLREKRRSDGKQDMED